MALDEIRKNNITVLSELNYGFEEKEGGRIDLYDDNTYLFLSGFENHKELAEWIKANIT